MQFELIFKLAKSLLVGVAYQNYISRYDSDDPFLDYKRHIIAIYLLFFLILIRWDRRL